MATIKGEVPEDLKKRFRMAIAERDNLQKGSISKSLTEAIELWLDRYESGKEKQQLLDQVFLQKLFQENKEKYLVINPKTREILSKGNDIVSVIADAKKNEKYILPVKVVSRAHIAPRRAHLGWRMRIKLSTSGRNTSL